MPAEFSQEVFDAICERIADGESLRSICRDRDMPNRSNVFRWVDADEGLRDQYARAQKASAEADADEMKDIANRTLSGEYDPQSARVAIDALKWSAGKRNPKKYGDKIVVGGDDDAPPIKVAAQLDVTALATATLKDLEGALSKDDPSHND